MNLVRTILIATFASLTAATACAQENAAETEPNWTDLPELPRDEDGNWILPDIDVSVSLARPEYTDQVYNFSIPFEWLDYRIPPLRRQAAATGNIEDGLVRLLAILQDGRLLSAPEAHGEVVQHIGQIEISLGHPNHFEVVLTPGTDPSLPIYARHTQSNVVRNGLRELVMPPNQQRQNLAYLGEHRLVGPVVVTCRVRSDDMGRDRPPHDEGYCRLVFEYEDGLNVFFSFPQHQFHQWESIVTSINGLIASFEQAAAAD